jgi:uncharacterized damage-inducible protein DinB
MEAEIQGYLTEFTIIWKDISNTVKGLDDEAANWHPLQKDSNSIFAILTHVMSADRFWIRQVILGEVVQRDREAEFRASGNLKELLFRWDKAWAENEAIMSTFNHIQLLGSRARPFQPNTQETITVQWIILHLITHYATHLGHIQLTRQLWDQRKTPQ